MSEIAPAKSDDTLGPISASSTVELSRRPSRSPNHAAENAALAALVRAMATEPDTILQQLSDTALALCNADSAGLSLLEEEDANANFHWRAISGEWASHRDGGTPRDFGPCGTVVDRNMPLLFSHPERDFPYFADASPLVEEALLVPFYIGGVARGTILVVLHDDRRRFDSEDLRLLTNLGNVSALAYQTVLSLAASKAVEQERAQSHIVMDRFRAIVESSDDAILSKTLDGVITSWNAGAERLFGYSAEEAVGKSVTMLIPAERADEEPNILARIRRGERIEHYETRRIRKDGSERDISLTVSPIRNAAGRVVGASKIARDITERRLVQERQSLLVNEMKHRIKNTLFMVQAIATQTLQKTTTDERDSFIARLHSLSYAHDVLTQENWHRSAVHEIIARTLEPFQTTRHDRFTVGGPTLWLNAERSTSLAMAIHELATNAAKYGALSNNTGRVSITWESPADGSALAKLEWKESGGPPVIAPARRGFGSRLIEGALAAEFDNPQLDFLPDGVICRLSIPLDR